jgi:hypothetical protein
VLELHGGDSASTGGNVSVAGGNIVAQVVTSVTLVGQGSGNVGDARDDTRVSTPSARA